MATLAIVTGGGTGLGRALALELAGRGCDVLVCGRRRAPLDQVREDASGNVEVCPADLAEPGGREAVREALQSRAVGCLVHNAGTLEPIGPLAGLSLEDWRRHQAVNIEAPLFLTQTLLPDLGRGARVLHVSSGAAHRPYQGWGPYCASKAALHMIYQVYRDELAQRGIAVGSARPGVVDTPMQERIRACSPEQFPHRDRFIRLWREGRLVAPETAASFLAALLLDVAAERFTAEEWDIRDWQEG